MELGGLDINFRLFDLMDSVLGYGAEIWAPELLCQDPLKKDRERVHLFALKWMLGVRKSTASCTVLAETGLWPLALRWVKRIARFYNGVVKASANSILKHVLKTNCQLTTHAASGTSPCIEKQSWAAQMQQAFGQFGVQISLEEPIELNVGAVCSKWKTWYLTKVRNLSGTKICKYVHEVRNGLPENEYVAAPYLEILDFRARQCFAQLRLGSHHLMEEVGRWMRLEREQRKCFEKGIEAVDTVEHLLFHCPNYDDIRADSECSKLYTK